MKSYFSVLNWVSNQYYIPGTDDDVCNALVPLEGDWNQDFKIGERVLPDYDLLQKLHNICIQYIKYMEGDESSNLNLKMKNVFKRFERVDNSTYMSWFLTNDEDDCIPGYIIENRGINPKYIEYKNKYLETILTNDRQKDSLDLFISEVNVIARIEVSDIIYDFVDQRKIYILEMKPFTY